MKKLIFISLVLFAVFINAKVQEQDKKIVNYELTKASLLKMKGVIDLLETVNPSEDYSKYVVRSFDLSLNMMGHEITETTAGDLFSEKEKKIIADAETGMKVYIEKIRVIEQGKKGVIMLPALILKIKE